MKVKKLIKKLQEFPENMEVKIFDWRKNLNDDCGDGSSAGIYNFTVSYVTLTEEEKEYYKERNEIDYTPFVELAFNNEDYTEDGAKYID